MFKRYNIVDERDLAEAGERLSVFLTDAASDAPTIVPIADARAARHATGHGQNTDNRADAAVVPAPEGHRKFLRTHCAGMAELADAADLKSPALTGVRVRLPLLALVRSRG